MPMARFGKNGYGDNLYRIVLAESRRMLIVGGIAQWGPCYPQAKDWFRDYGTQWVLEKWVSAFRFTGMTASQWNRDSNNLILGPYPDRGEYIMCGNLPILPEVTNIDKLIAMVDAGSSYSWSEKLEACKKKQEYADAMAKSTREAIIRECLPTFGTTPMVGHGGARGTKTSPILRSANELGLPLGGGARAVKVKNPRKYDVKLKLA
jgi:hypothetical protein